MTSLEIGDEAAATVAELPASEARPSGAARHYLDGPGGPDTPMYVGKHWRRWYDDARRGGQARP